MGILATWITLMLNKQLYSCRVCGFLQSEPPWGEDGKTPNFVICDCCGVEFGYEDCSITSTKNFRNNWMSSGMKWAEPKEQPKDWSFEIQSKNIPKGFQ